MLLEPFYFDILLTWAANYRASKATFKQFSDDVYIHYIALCGLSYFLVSDQVIYLPSFLLVKFKDFQVWQIVNLKNIFGTCAVAHQKSAQVLNPQLWMPDFRQCY